MAQLVPVDYDPFAPRLVPVEHDPFDTASLGPSGTGAPQPPPSGGLPEDRGRPREDQPYPRIKKSYAGNE